MGNKLYDSRNQIVTYLKWVATAQSVSVWPKAEIQEKNNLLSQQEGRKQIIGRNGEIEKRL